MDWLNYHQLMSFWLVVREGSVQRASELLHVTPSSVSLQIGQLERSMKVELLEKRGRGVVATSVGREVANYANTIFSTGRELIEFINGTPVGQVRMLRVGIRDVMPKLEAFRLLEPALKLSEPLRLVCYEAELPQLVADLSIHKLDVVLSDSPLDPFYKVRAYSHAIGESDVVIMGSKELATKYGSKFPTTLQDAPFLMPLHTSALRNSLDHWLNDRKLTPQIKGEFADSAMLKIAGRRGLGLFAVSTSIQDEVAEIYDVVSLGLAEGVKERCFAISVERKVKHPAVLAIQNAARRP